jgi:phage anti-repressor protein
LQNEDTSGLLFTNEADVQLLLSCLQPAAHSQQLLQILKTSQESEPKANIGGNLTVAVIKTPDGRQSFRVLIDEGKRKHVLERVEQVRQSAQWALRNKFKPRNHEREGR